VLADSLEFGQTPTAGRAGAGVPNDVADASSTGGDEPLNRGVAHRVAMADQHASGPWCSAWTGRLHGGSTRSVRASLRARNPSGTDMAGRLLRLTSSIALLE
jgi:hypothetical protein